MRVFDFYLFGTTLIFIGVYSLFGFGQAMITSGILVIIGTLFKSLTDNIFHDE